MKCLSLMQPWATLVVLGAKCYETRRWHTEYRGRIAIHASRTFPEACRALCPQEPFRSVLHLAGCRQSADLPCGVIIGTVELVDCFPAWEMLARFPAGSPEAAFGDYHPGRWAWKLDEPIMFAVPIPYPGRLGLFDVPDAAFDGHGELGVFEQRDRESEIRNQD
jgi:hypothetical protein